MVETILQAAVRVLAREGANRFTTARVADRAGVSVGSLYQYFPNKQAILFRLQTDEWKRTGALLEGILTDDTIEPLQRVREMVRAFFHSEWEEAALRLALGDAAPSYRDASEVAEHRKAGRRRTAHFMSRLLPGCAVSQRRFLGEFLMTVMSSLGKRISEQATSAGDVDRWARATSDMLCAYLERERTTAGATRGP
jgi:AcrR family transcriptional regulator